MLEQKADREQHGIGIDDRPIKHRRLLASEQDDHIGKIRGELRDPPLNLSWYVPAMTRANSPP